ncbi:hypothetical protein [Clostridium sp. DJ247]|uniref:hypothetical protein n=1 Tax=Clostridium sp. DJ247 TaxID=2726188 RepID=UPI00162817DA|nr:hypothetical protein [Clostridium sp. DJ247]MBC2579531.1 hypothetical protein [Clostridium sp. DJ247]
MPQWLTLILQILFFVVIYLVVYTQLKNRLLSKLHPNKWLILILAAAVFFIPNIIAAYYKYNLNGTIWQYAETGVFIILFLWFIDLQTGAMYNVPGKRGKKDDVVIRPKAKPNRTNNIGNKKNKN